MNSPYQKELEIAIALARHAASISRAALANAVPKAASVQEDGAAAANANTSNIQNLVKDDFSPVTVADFAIQALLAGSLSRIFPSDSFIGEESADDLRQNSSLLECVCRLLVSSSPSVWSPVDETELCAAIDRCTTLTGALGPGSGRVWVFDPIDGTKAYMRGEHYAVNIALLEAGKQVLSVVALPLLDHAQDVSSPVSDADLDPAERGTILFAVRGHGTYIVPLAADPSGRQEPAPPRKLPRHAAEGSPELTIVTSTKLDCGIEPIHSAVAASLDISSPGCDLLGWVPRWSALAMGLGNVTVWVYKSRTRTAKLWDHAGAMLLFEEVGGKITDVHGQDIDLSQGRALRNNFGFVAAPPSQHGRVLKAVQDALRDKGREDLLV